MKNIKNLGIAVIGHLGLSTVQAREVILETVKIRERDSAQHVMVVSNEQEEQKQQISNLSNPIPFTITRIPELNTPELSGKEKRRERRKNNRNKKQ